MADQPMHYWLVQHTHRHGTSSMVIQHPTIPDAALVEAYAKKILDYEPDRDDEYLEWEGIEVLTMDDITKEVSNG